MQKTAIVLLAGVFVAGCGKQSPPVPVGADGKPVSLVEARKGFQSSLTPAGEPKTPAPPPPPGVFTLVQYDAPGGKLAAYLSPPPGDGKKHPAIVWIVGGDCNSIDDGCWTEGPPANDQSAGAYRKAGIVMMFPSLRGGNNNPGNKEGFLGEVDDVRAATDFLAKQDHVDPARVYLGGHSTGGTLVLLTAEATDRFRAVFSFGPVGDVSGYGREYLPFNASNRKEVELRSPGRWLHSVQSPVFVFEGDQQGNLSELQNMQRVNTNPLAHFYAVKGASHFSILAPMNRLVAAKILADSGPKTNITFTEQELNGLFGR